MSSPVLPALPIHAAWLRALGAVACLSLACQCVLVPTLGKQRLQQDLEQVQALAPSRWTAEDSAQSGAGWLEDFHAAGYRKWIHEALAHNHDLRAAAARMRQSKAEMQRLTAGMLPTLSASFQASRTQSPGDQRFNTLPPINNRFRVPLEVSWEIDLWGRVADDRRAAKARWLAAQDTYEAAQLSLIASVLRAAITLTEAELQHRLAVENHQSRQTQLRVLERVLERGLSAERAALDVSLGRADLARAEASIGQRAAAADQARRAMEVLLGRYPASRESGLRALPQLSRPRTGKQPLAVIAQRPDLRAAQNRLQSALALQSSSIKAFLPSLNLTGNMGRTAQETGQVFTPEAAIWSIASSVSQSLFQGGRNLANFRLSKARYDEELSLFTQAVLKACQEVETALAADEFLRQQVLALEASAQQAEQAERLAQSQYERGLIEALTLLDSRQRAFDARTACISAQSLRLRTRVDLHLALGGAFAKSP